MSYDIQMASYAIKENDPTDHLSNKETNTSKITLFVYQRKEQLRVQKC